MVRLPCLVLSVQGAQVPFVLLWSALLQCCLTWRTHCTDSVAPTVLVILIKLPCQIWSIWFSPTPHSFSLCPHHPPPVPFRTLLFLRFVPPLSVAFVPASWLRRVPWWLWWWFDGMAPGCGSSKFKRLSLSQPCSIQTPLSMGFLSVRTSRVKRVWITASLQQNRQGTVSSHDFWDAHF